MDKTQKFWDRQARTYDYSERQFAPVFAKVLAKTKKHLGLNDVVLDFGCATGTKTMELAPATKHIHGLDISSEMIAKALEKKNNTNGANISFSQGTIATANFEKASFDKVIAYGILHLVDDTEKVIQHIHDLLKPGGLFISTTACLKGKMAFKNKLEFSIYRLLKGLGTFPLHLNMFDIHDVEKLVRDQNFQLVESEKIFHGISICHVIARKV
jgi:2-polyprenyl-3-methyl-5-hydroxy-6-metoxy-1,4-benzoquinol methylase